MGWQSPVRSKPGCRSATGSSQAASAPALPSAAELLVDTGLGEGGPINLVPLRHQVRALALRQPHRLLLRAYQLGEAAVAQVSVSGADRLSDTLADKRFLICSGVASPPAALPFFARSRLASWAA